MLLPEPGGCDPLSADTAVFLLARVTQQGWGSGGRARGCIGSAKRPFADLGLGGPPLGGARAEVADLVPIGWGTRRSRVRKAGGDAEEGRRRGGGLTRTEWPVLAVGHQRLGWGRGGLRERGKEGKGRSTFKKPLGVSNPGIANCPYLHSHHLAFPSERVQHTQPLGVKVSSASGRVEEAVWLLAGRLLGIRIGPVLQWLAHKGPCQAGTSTQFF